jgi:hypothetical protein
MKSRKKARNVFFDDRGFPDESDAYDHLLHNIEGGVVLRRKKFDTPALDQDNPDFHYSFDKSLHGNRPRQELNLSHLTPEQSSRLSALIKQYWCVFDDRGTFIPVRNYQCVIDTGSARPIAVKKIHYGPRETVIMRKSIAALEKVGQISQIHDGAWLFKALLAAKPIASCFTFAPSSSSNTSIGTINLVFFNKENIAGWFSIAEVSRTKVCSLFIFSLFYFFLIVCLSITDHELTNISL